ncbi:MAG: hypothetical protein IJA35_01065 [Clostridia bacterium]|nr:hypothetical protein [Clostridia bacterium]
MKRPLSRYLITTVVVVLLMGALIFQLGMVALSGNNIYVDQAEERKTRTITIKGARGSIMDRNGVVLAYDEVCYNVEFLRDANNRTSYDSAIYTQSLIDAINVIQKGGGEIIDTSYIRMDDEGNFYYDWGVTSDRAIKLRYKNYCDAMGFKIPEDDMENLDTWDLDKWISAEDAYLSLRAAWYIPEELTFEEANKIISIRQEVNLNNYRAYLPVTIAYNVSSEVVAEIESLSNSLPGLQIEQSTTRVYPYGETGANIIGYLSKQVSEDMLDMGYNYDDYIGVSGIEATMEDYLTGATKDRQGYRIIEINKSGAEVSEIESVPAKNGNDVLLTIDVNLQKITEQALERLIGEIAANETALIETDEDGKYGKYDGNIDIASTGAIVILDVTNGQTLAMASYPSFDPNWFIEGLDEERFEALFGESTINTTPTLNKAISMRLAPGSIFKMVTGFAGLMEGELLLTETISDGGKYILIDEDGNKIERNAPKCWTDNPSSHIDQDIVKALTNSCNYFFYEVANRLGIERLNGWAEQFGLASPTNVQLTSEITGYIGGQDVLFDNTLIEFGDEPSLGSQKASLPSYIYRVLKEKLRTYLDFCGKTASDEDITECALKLMELQDGSLVGKGAAVRRILSETIGIPEGISVGQPWVSEIMSFLNEIQWKASQTIRTGIGQGVSVVTPIAVARYVAAIANGGTVYDVNIIDRIMDSDGMAVEVFEPVIFNQIDAPEAYWQAIRDGLKGVVSPEDGGTAAAKFSKEFREKGYLDMISGKTGSAQVGTQPLDIENTAWFVTFAPRDNPEIAVVVCIPNGFSGSSCVPAIEEIITYFFDRQSAAAPENLVGSNQLLP